MKGMFDKTDVFKIGFTGSSSPLPKLQTETLSKVLLKYTKNKRCELHNGCCIEGDETCRDLFIEHAPDMPIVYHPPENEYKMFKFKLRKGDQKRKPLPYLKRNLAIVSESHFLIATPKSVAEELRSGTWSAIRYARIAEIPRLIIFPNGSLRLEEN